MGLGDDEPLGQHRLVEVIAEEAGQPQLLRRQPRLVEEQDTEPDANEREQVRVPFGIAEPAQALRETVRKDPARESGPTARLESRPLPADVRCVACRPSRRARASRSLAACGRGPTGAHRASGAARSRRRKARPRAHRAATERASAPSCPRRCRALHRCNRARSIAPLDRNESAVGQPTRDVDGDARRLGEHAKPVRTVRTHPAGGHEQELASEEYRARDHAAAGTELEQVADTVSPTCLSVESDARFQA